MKLRVFLIPILLGVLLVKECRATPIFDLLSPFLGTDDTKRMQDLQNDPHDLGPPVGPSKGLGLSAAGAGSANAELGGIGASGSLAGSKSLEIDKDLGFLDKFHDKVPPKFDHPPPPPPRKHRPPPPPPPQHRPRPPPPQKKPPCDNDKVHNNYVRPVHPRSAGL